MSGHEAIESLLLQTSVLQSQIDRAADINQAFIRPRQGFIAGEVQERLLRQSGLRILTYDIGGDKCTQAEGVLQNGVFVVESTRVRNSNFGEGYFSFILQDMGRNDIDRVGFSVAGEVEGTKLKVNENLARLITDLAAFDGDFAPLFTGKPIGVVNDANAIAQAGAMEAYSLYPQRPNVIAPIVGSGFGMAGIINGRVYESEQGHIKLSPELNIFNQDKGCERRGDVFVCAENVAAGKAGIDDIARKLGLPADGKQLAVLYEQGDERVIMLYNLSALIVALGVVGFAKALEADPKTVTVVGHGGVFSAKMYPGLLEKYLYRLGFEAPLITTNSFRNPLAGNQGAAIAAALT